MYKITAYPNGKLTIISNLKVEIDNHKKLKAPQCIQGESEVYEKFEDVVHRAAEVPIIPSELLDGKRLAKNVLSNNLVVLDIDDSLSLNNALEILNKSNYTYGLYTSYSHQKFNTDKYHIIFPSDRNIENDLEYKATYALLSSNLFNCINDGATKSQASLFYNSNPESKQVIIKIGNPIPVQTAKQEVVIHNKTKSIITPDRKKLYRSTMWFLLNGAEDGEWHAELIKAAKNFKACGYTLEEAIEKFEAITGVLTDSDRYQITYSYKDNRYNANIELVPAETHALRLKYVDNRGKWQQIPDREIIDAFKKEKHLNIHIDGQFTLDGERRGADYVFEEIRHFAQTELKTNLSMATVESVLNKLIVDEKTKRLSELREYVKFDNSEFSFEQLCFGITGAIDPITVSILKHFVWQIKRKLNDKNVEWHIMPVLVGKSGSGKSQLIRSLLAPIKELVYSDGDFKKLTDNREVFNLSNYYVYFLDEMSKADNADVESIKNKITSNEIKYRKLGTNQTYSAPNRATFLGASNNNLEYIIKDSTSARRFFQITTLPIMDWETTKRLNYLNMFRSVDENKGVDDLYIKPYMDEIFKAQQSFKHKTPVEVFLQEEKLTINPACLGKKVSRKDLYKNFSMWSAENGYKYTTNKHVFCDQLRSLVGEPIFGKVDGKYTDYYLLIPKDESSSLELRIL